MTELPPTGGGQNSPGDGCGWRMFCILLKGTNTTCCNLAGSHRSSSAGSNYDHKGKIENIQTSIDGRFTCGRSFSLQPAGRNWFGNSNINPRPSWLAAYDDIAGQSHPEPDGYRHCNRTYSSDSSLTQCSHMVGLSLHLQTCRWRRHYDDEPWMDGSLQ